MNSEHDATELMVSPGPVAVAGPAPIERGRIAPQRQTLVVASLLLADVVFAFAAWWAAYAAGGAILGAWWIGGPYAPPAPFDAVPDLVVWVGLRALLGLYPGYGLGVVEEVRRQTLAVLGTLTISGVFSFAATDGHHLSAVLLLLFWAVGLSYVSPAP